MGSGSVAAAARSWGMTREHPGSGSEEVSVGALFAERLRQQVVELREQESRVRLGADSGVHKMRIAVRRLRSALATYRTVLEPTATLETREELRWLGAELSPARDAQVQLERLDLLVKTEPVELVMGPVAKRIHTELTGRRLAGQERALSALDSSRYAELLDALDALVAAPPFDDAADRPARTELPRLLARDLRRVRRRAETVHRTSDPTHRDAALHETRKVSLLVAGRAAAVLGRAINGHVRSAAAVAGDPDGRAGARDTLRRRYDAQSAAELLAAAGLRVEETHGVRVLADLLPAAVVEEDPKAVLELELALSARPPFRDIAAQLHLFARRP
jgi:inorganic triphosphatase YgiF